MRQQEGVVLILSTHVTSYPQLLQNFQLNFASGKIDCIFSDVLSFYSRYLSVIVRVIKSRRMRWSGHVARMDEERGLYRVLVVKPEGRRPLVRPRRRWVDNIKMDLREVGCGHMDWIGLAQDRDRWRTFVSAVLNLRVPLNTGNSLTSYKTVSFSRRTLHHGVSK